MTVQETDQLLGNLRLVVWVVEGEACQAGDSVLMGLLSAVIQQLHDRGNAACFGNGHLVDGIDRKMP